ncbi:ATP-grasp domain-containing protein [Streptomyces sp. WMMB 322]|uniref:ATP-grasp domain-containing protein n=1 Tax=Streptomyces sp. WMMB 322 TaxID=1286821 RepID=UPI0006E39F4D|nr:ATP-grasp domain-containing protein [Streptomyces sp. WMMB 322]SCK09771.1 ATP-grasp domain-containing protein [Streptomyces sp. WMMB 322]
MIALINPVSSGATLADAFQEEGADCLHIYTQDQESAFHAAASGTAKAYLHAQLSETAEHLRSVGVNTVVAASEFGVTLADELSELLELPHQRHELRAARRDKYLMAGALADAGLSHARTVMVRSEGELRDALDGWDAFPVVIKPLNSAGSDGCHISADADEALSAYRGAAGRLNLMGEVNQGVLVQEFLDGTQYIVNTVSMEGRHLLTEVYAERIDRVEDAPVLRHIISRPALEDAEQDLVDYVLRCLDALGVREGAAHTEVVLTSRGPRLVEVNSRVMGPCLAPDPYHAAYGYSHQHLTVERFLRPEDFRKRFDLPYGPARTVAKVFLRSHRPGVVLAMDGLRTMRRLPGFHSIARLPAIGVPVQDRYLTTGASGIAFFVHEDDELLEHSLATLHDIEDAAGMYRIAEVDG